MEAAAQGRQRFQIHGILVPQREGFLHRSDFFLGFLDEQFNELRIDRLRLRYDDQRIGCRMRALGALHRNGFRWIQLHRLGSFAAGEIQVRHARERVILRERLEAGFGVVQHVPRIGAPVLQRLHVVLDADDGIGHSLQADRIRRRRARLDEHADLLADGVHQLHRPALAEHQQSGGYAAQQLRHIVESLRREFVGFLYRGRNRFLDARQVDDAFAQHRLADLPEFLVLIARNIRGGIGRLDGQDQPYQLIVKAVLHRQENAGNSDQRILGRRLAVLNDLRQRLDFILHALTQLA